MDPARPEGLGGTGLAGACSDVVELDASAGVGMATAGVMTS